MDWDAARYHRLSEPQFEWGRHVLRRLSPVAGERILDIGCGTARLTAEILAEMGSGLVVGLDRSAAMLEQAATERPWERHQKLHDVTRPAEAVHLVRGDAAHLPFADAFDALFSTATFHWVRDHDELFASLYRALVPGGRLVAQCGGGPNLQLLLDRAHRLMCAAPYREHFGEWADPWNFADVPGTISRLERAGFTLIDVTLEPAPTTLPDAVAYGEFLSCVCVRHHIDRLPVPLRSSFVAALTADAAHDSPAFTLDYWRLNVSARKPVGRERAA